MKINIQKETFLRIITILYLILITFLLKVNKSNILVINSTFLLIITYIYYVLYGYRKDKLDINKKQLLYKQTINALYTYIFIFILGFFFGYSKNSINFTSIAQFIFYSMNIIFIEAIRYININKNRNIKSLTCINFILFSEVMFLSLYNITSLNILTLLIIFIYNHILNFTCRNVGTNYNILSRILYEILFFSIPIIPNINLFLIFIFLFISFYLNYKNIRNSINAKNNIEKNNKYLNFIFPFSFIAVIICLLILISCKAPYYIVGIGSTSMKPNINKGDIVLVKKIKEDTILNIDDIVVYEYEDSKIIHRIFKIIEKDNKKIYITKGDNNHKEDEIELNLEDIEGIVIYNIPYIGYPSIILDNIKIE